MATVVNGENHYDRAVEVQRFDESKIGVKGLVDSGLTTIPPIFIHPIDTLSDLKAKPQSVVVPTIDLSGPRSTVLEQVASASRTFGDTLRIKLGRRLPELEDIPEVCRDEVVQWNLHSEALGERLMGLLSEGLGLDMDRLKNSCLDARTMLGHYYPRCPQPDLTVGIASHTDPGVLTLLLQDHIGGLQIKHKGGWVDVKPVHGALVINIADILQILSNDEYVSVEHRVLANPSKEPRVSIAVFFSPSARETLYGPFSELTSPEKPLRYCQFVYHDYMRRFFTKELDGKTLTNYYRI
ncbi:hypothetical protein V6N12_017139 [Hibiscus sabdariffa]|uniref:Fe2OG dioxygenase domain-containing protein n=1 Tax=Hibiscus sabdariffa TaxID=183260 RepID=A0ABR2BCL5_9ROSI